MAIKVANGETQTTNVFAATVKCKGRCEKDTRNRTWATLDTGNLAESGCQKVSAIRRTKAEGIKESRSRGIKESSSLPHDTRAVRATTRPQHIASNGVTNFQLARRVHRIGSWAAVEMEPELYRKTKYETLCFASLLFSVSFFLMGRTSLEAALKLRQSWLQSCLCLSAAGFHILRLASVNMLAGQQEKKVKKKPARERNARSHSQSQDND